MKRKNYFARFITLSLVFVLAFSAYAMPASAAVAYDTYTYDTYSSARVAPDGYQVTKVVNGVDIGAGKFSSPKDIFVRNDHIYILDSGYVGSDAVTDENGEAVAADTAETVTETTETATDASTDTSSDSSDGGVSRPSGHQP